MFLMPYQELMKISTSFSLVILLVSLTTLHAADPPHAPVAGDSGTAANQPRNPSIETQEPVAEPPDETRAVVTIDSGAPSVRYSPMIFGGFLEHFERQIYGGLFEPGSPLAGANNSLIYWDSQTQLIEISGRSCLKSSRFSSHFLGCLP